jgi:peptide/nickel transport system substrate-binding protein
MRLMPALLLSTTLLAVPALAATPPNTLVMAKQIDDIITFDPAEAYELSAIEVDTNVYDRIVRYEADDLTKMVGGVASGWTISPDHKTITFTIRPGQTFHDGTPLTAEDAAFSLQRVVILNKTPGFLLTQLGLTKDNVAAMVHATDPQTLVVSIPKDFAPTLVLNLLSSIVGSVVEKKLALEHQDKDDLGNTWLKAHDAGSGPFRLVSWKPNESVSLEAVPSYRLGAATIKRVVIRHVPEPATQQLLLQKGDIDIARDLTVDQVSALAGDKDVKFQTTPGTAIPYVGFNQSYAPLANPKVREALKYAVDYQGMADTFLKGRYTVHETFLPDGFFGYLKYTPFKLDIAKAKALLAEAGYPNGFALKMDAFNASPWTEMSQSIQQTFGQAGVKVSIIPEEAKQLYTVYRGRKHQAALLYWGPDYNDPHTNADGFAYNVDDSDSSTHKVLAWRNHWLIPGISAQTLAAAAEADPDKRAADYQALQKTVTDEGPYIFLFQDESAIALRADVKGFVAGNASDFVYYRTVTK